MMRYHWGLGIGHIYTHSSQTKEPLETICSILVADNEVEQDNEFEENQKVRKDGHSPSYPASIGNLQESCYPITTSEEDWDQEGQARFDVTPELLLDDSEDKLGVLDGSPSASEDEAEYQESEDEAFFLMSEMYDSETGAI